MVVTEIAGEMPRNQLSLASGGFAMSRSVSTFLAATASLLAALCVVVAGAGGGSAAASSHYAPADPTTTATTVDNDGNPWHG
jgi:hypothetical protein